MMHLRHAQAIVKEAKYVEALKVIAEAETPKNGGLVEGDEQGNVTEVEITTDGPIETVDSAVGE